MKNLPPPLYDRDGEIWFNGEFKPWRDAQIHVLTHTLHYGVGVFEGIRAYQTERGPAIFRLDEHVERLFQSAHILRMDLDKEYTPEQVRTAIMASVTRNKLDSAYIRPMAFYGAEYLGIHAGNLSTNLIVASWDWGKFISEADQRVGIDVKVSSYARHHVNVAMCKAKANGHYINSVLAVREIAGEYDADGNRLYREALLLDTEGFVAEGPGENIFIVRRGEVHTPDLTSCLDGVTRRTLMQLLQDEFGLRVIERRITRDEVYVADEAFFCGTAAEVVPIRSLDRRCIGNGKPGPITQKLQQKYFAVVHGKEAKYLDWLSFC